MATSPEGIMSLPTDGQMSTPPGTEQPEGKQQTYGDMGLSRSDAFDATRTALMQTHPDQGQEMQATLEALAAELVDVPEEQLQMLLGLVQYMQEHEEEYSSMLKNLLSQGVIESGDFPEEFDPEFLASFEMVLTQALNDRRQPDAAQDMAPPPGFAQGGIANAVQQVASKGRNGDTMLAHITPEEASLLKRRGGSGTINPETGLYEYWNPLKAIRKAVKSVTKVVKNVLKSPVGKIIGTVALTAVAGMALPALGVSSAFAAPVANAATTLLSGGSVKDALISGAVSYFGGANSPINQYTSGIRNALGITSNVATSAFNQGLVGTAAGVLSGKSLNESIKTGLTNAAMGAAGEYFDKGYQKDYMSPINPMTSDLPPANLGLNGAGGTASSMSSATGPGSSGHGGMWDSFTGMFKDEKGNYSPWKIGLGVAGAGLLMGGTEQGELQQSEFEQNMRKPLDMPENLTKPVQNMRGVTYTPDGQIDTSVNKPWNPYDYPSSYGPSAPQASLSPWVTQPPPNYQVPGQIPFSNSLSIPQPYNTANPYTNLMPQPQQYNAGGIAGLADGGYPRRIGRIDGPGTSTSDSIPAMLSDGEFVMTADAVRGAGNGNREHGAQRMYQLMHQFEKNA